jgi:tol-pal system protein YbgF
MTPAFMRHRPLWAVAGALLLSMPVAHAGLFDDDEARKAILDLRQRIAQIDAQSKQNQADAQAANAQLGEQVASMRRSLLELNSQIELMRAEIARLRGANEQVLRDLSEVQRTQKDANQNFDDRLRKLEPQRVTHDGREFSADPVEKKAYDDAIAVMRAGDFDKAVAVLSAFQAKYPRSGYSDSVRFWLGNALYGKRDYKGAIAAFRALVSDAPDHPKAPEALLALANSQAEMKDTKAARKTLDELVKAYPQSEAAAAAKDRIAALR